MLVSAMHISASVFVNDHEPGLWKDILDWLEKRIAPWSPDDYRHNSGTGEDNAAAHLRSLTVGHEVIVPVTRGKLDFGPWQRVFYGEWDGQRPKRVGRRRSRASVPNISPHRAATRGLIAAPWTPASHLPCSRGGVGGAFRTV